jgi:DNA-binding protein HU-beta
MAKKKNNNDLFSALRTQGIRKRVARALSELESGSRETRANAEKLARRAVADLRSAADALEKRLNIGTPAKKTSRKSTARKSTARKTTRKAAPRKTTARKSTARKSTGARKTTARKSTARKTTGARKTSARKSTARKSSS